jgi:phage shock protein A
MEIRAELEKEIKRLQDQVVELKAENKKLKTSNVEWETKYNASRQKSQDIIASLRGWWHFSLPCQI